MDIHNQYNNHNNQSKKNSEMFSIFQSSTSTVVSQITAINMEDTSNQRYQIMDIELFIGQIEKIRAYDCDKNFFIHENDGSQEYNDWFRKELENLRI